jgi:hypothetical protein
LRNFITSRTGQQIKAYLATILKALLVAIKTVVISSTNAICAVCLMDAMLQYHKI